jgi:hypothetical protein
MLDKAAARRTGGRLKFIGFLGFWPGDYCINRPDSIFTVANTATGKCIEPKYLKEISRAGDNHVLTQEREMCPLREDHTAGREFRIPPTAYGEKLKEGGSYFKRNLADEMAI